MTFGTEWIAKATQSVSHVPLTCPTICPTLGTHIHETICCILDARWTASWVQDGFNPDSRWFLTCTHGNLDPKQPKSFVKRLSDRLGPRTLVVAQTLYRDPEGQRRTEQRVWSRSAQANWVLDVFPGFWLPFFRERDPCLYVEVRIHVLQANLSVC